MIPEEWRRGEVAVLGLGRTGMATAEFLSKKGYDVYASDSDDSAALKAAARRLKSSGVSCDLGHHDIDRIARASLVVTSPGLPPYAAPLRAASDAGVTILAELDLAMLYLEDVPAVVVSGTNGKSTTTALIAHLLNESGINAVAAGNLGNPLIEVAGRRALPDCLVVEASSYQLHFSPHLAPTVGVLTNISPDHLDWHGSVEEYTADKRRLFDNATQSSLWVLNGDDPKVLELATGAAGRQMTWSLVGSADASYDRTRNLLMLNGEELVPRLRFPLLGDHNVSNALAATLAAAAIGARPDIIAFGLESFRSLPHRLEPIREVAGVLWINDSKATNISSTEVAVQAITRSFVLLLGGRGKGEPYSRLAQIIVKNCHDIVAYGEDGETIFDELGELVPTHLEVSFEAAFEKARSLAVRGDAVLLSPACASFDQFLNFEHRGDVFRGLVEAL